jgi:hypothetical protein
MRQDPKTPKRDELFVHRVFATGRFVVLAGPRRTVVFTHDFASREDAETHTKRIFAIRRDPKTGAWLDS